MLLSRYSQANDFGYTRTLCGNFKMMGSSTISESLAALNCSTDNNMAVRSTISSGISGRTGDHHLVGLFCCEQSEMLIDSWLEILNQNLNCSCW